MPGVPAELITPLAQMDAAAAFRAAPALDGCGDCFCLVDGEHFSPAWAHHPIGARICETGDPDLIDRYARAFYDTLALLCSEHHLALVWLDDCLLLCEPAFAECHD